MIRRDCRHFGHLAGASCQALYRHACSSSRVSLFSSRDLTAGLWSFLPRFACCLHASEQIVAWPLHRETKTMYWTATSTSPPLSQQHRLSPPSSSSSLTSPAGQRASAPEQLNSEAALCTPWSPLILGTSTPPPPADRACSSSNCLSQEHLVPPSSSPPRPTARCRHRHLHHRPRQQDSPLLPPASAAPAGQRPVHHRCRSHVDLSINTIAGPRRDLEQERVILIDDSSTWAAFSISSPLSQSPQHRQPHRRRAARWTATSTSPPLSQQHRLSPPSSSSSLTSPAGQRA